MLRISYSRRLRLLKVGADSKRHISSSIVQRQAVPAVATQPPSGGFLSWLLGDKPAVKVPPLHEPLEGVKVPSPLPDFVKPAETKLSVLPNGLKVASENTMGPTATIGIYVNSGSMYENPLNFGVTHLLEKMAFKSTLNRSHLRLVREVEAIGGNITASASREQMSYTGDAIKTHMPEMVELLVDSVRNPVFHAWEVKEQLAAIKVESAEASKNPQTLLLEALHSAGYAGALGQPLLAPESALVRLNPDVLHEFIAENYTAPRMVLAASGVDHNELLSVAEPLLADLPAVPLTQPPVSEYVGGDWRGQADTPRTHVAVAFEVPGGWRNEKDAITATVLQTLLGGGGSFSAGGPGKGMYSRLYLRVLNHYGDVESFTAFSAVYNDTGLFGIHATSVCAFCNDLHYAHGIYLKLEQIRILFLSLIFNFTYNADYSLR
ncbi:hypothetical protein O6H91_07G035900 [Diphasiastrum complanatum]|uniref:Uncharacterized protein n=1 Tax=Diphasiastrum complanatum TaxID=34168 RepID=A0ACC2D403_DIPCM|nr:hypothetical protein O6H91_07G035900 [Diphasiastrum complanatum]